ncbi:MAG TPA: GNAT family protein [Virgibacillus sp.]|nr:GNAT family protein [Virgibacillus sp.]
MKLESKRIYLRNIRKSDAETILDTTKIDEMRYMTGTKHTFTLDQIKDYIEKVPNDPSRYDFAICLKDNDNMIGDLSILDINKEDSKAGFRIALSTIDLTGEGYGTEAIRCVLPFVFEELKLNRLQLEVYSHNLRGIRSYEKVGFIKEGVLRQSLFYNGTYSDEIIMALLKEDYDNLLIGKDVSFAKHKIEPSDRG